ncbi:myosin-binding protein H-like [Diadema setosum]|uniref:myosin-binding protein H-like n=1 Tax=Diadema setosum TaxID=31175 RepID=UPI003B3A3877
MTTSSRPSTINPFCYSDVPSQPDRIKVDTIQADSVTLTWAAPQRDGGAPVTGYFVEKREKARPDAGWTRTSYKPITDTAVKVPRLMEGKEYEFRVSAVNKAGMSVPASLSAPITVERPAYAPKLDLGNRYRDVLTVRAGNHFTLDVPITGTPTPTVAWLKDDKRCDDGKRIRSSTTSYSASLTNKEAKRSDSGTYTVKISNKAGSDTANIRVVVLGEKPFLTT